MDWIKRGKNLTGQLKKYRYGLLVLAIGLALMLLPTGQKAESDQVPETPPEEIGLETRLEAILCQIQGAGKVRVLLTESAGQVIHYQTDMDRTRSGDSESERQDMVIITESDRRESGLIRSITPPTYLGALVICQGADSPAVRLAVVEAVANVTGLGSDRITVLKMK